MTVLAPTRAAQREAGRRPDQGAWPRRPAARSAPRHLPGADALRALAAVAVIVIHASAWPLQDHGADHAVYTAINLLARFAVPAFVLLTGLLLAYRYGDQPLGRAFLFRRARRSVLPWLIWAPIFCAADILMGFGLAPNGADVRDWWSSGAGHLYFLLLVPQLYVLLLVWPARRRALAVVTAAAVALQVALSVVRLYVPMHTGVARQVMLVHGYELFPFWIGYFAIGVVAGRWLLSRRGRGLPAWPFLVAVPFTAWLLLSDDVGRAANSAYGHGTGAFLRPMLLPFVLALCGAVIFAAPRVQLRMPRLRRATDVVGRHSLGVYIVHPLLLTVLGRAVKPELHAHLPWSMLPVLGMVGGSLCGSLLFCAVLARTPLAAAIGEERVRPRRERRLVGRPAV